MLIIIKNRMKKVIVKIGNRKNPRCIYVADIKKLYFFKKRTTPKLPKFGMEETEPEI